MSEHWGLVSLVLGYVLTLFLIRWVLLTRIRTPVSAVAWILAIVILPLAGGLLFLLFGINRVERRRARKEAASRALSRERDEMPAWRTLAIDDLEPARRPLARLVHQIADTLPTPGNAVEVLQDTNRTLGLITQAVLAARRSIHIQFYIYRGDRTGTALRDTLIEKAREGVAVRFLYDGFGSLWLSRRFLRAMTAAGIRVASFLPGPSLRERWSINLRNHRKIVIVDGELGFTGGMNIGDEYRGRSRTLGYWRDTHLRLRGATVNQLQRVFAEDWFYATGEDLVHPEFFPRPDESGHVVAQVVAGGPAGDERGLLDVFFGAINEARERVSLATSYFVPPEALAIALEAAALRGVRVRLLVAGRSEYRWTVLAGRSFYEPLLRAGVEIHEFLGGFLHSKVLVIDGDWAFVGSPNFDARSLLLNFEAGVALYDRGIAAQLEADFERDLERAGRIELETWLTRPTRHVLAENASRLFAPVM